MIETSETTIDERAVMVTQLPGREGFKLKLKLGRTFGPAIGEIIAGLDSNEESKKEKKSSKKITDFSTDDFDLGSISNAIRSLFEKTDEDKMLSIIMRILACTRLDNKEITDAVFDTEFAGDFGLMYKIVGYTLQVNYTTLFGKGGIGQFLRNLTS